MARTKKKRELPSDERVELVSHLPLRTEPLDPYLKSFLNEKGQTEVNGGILRYTACSTNKWPAPKGDSR